MSFIFPETVKNRVKFYDTPYTTPEMIEAGYGCGHGMEIFKVKNPYSPEFVSVIKAPPLYCGKNDTWRVRVSGERAYLCDTYNGIFVIDISDKTSPSFEAYYRSEELTEQLGMYFPTVQTLYKPINGIAIADGYIFAAESEDGLRVIKCETAKKESLSHHKEAVGNVTAREIFKCSAQIHNFDVLDGNLVLSCGTEGIYILSPDYNVLKHIQTKEICSDVSVNNGYIYSSEGKNGLSVYDINGALKNTFIVEGSVKESVIIDDTLYLHINSALIGICRIRDSEIELIKTVRAGGIIYKRNFAKKPLEGKLLVDSLSYCGGCFDKNGEKLAADYEEGCMVEDGITSDGSRAVITHKGKYLEIKSTDELKNASDEIFKEILGANLNGKPFICGDMLIILNGCNAHCEVVSINEKKLIAKGILCGLPEFAGEYNSKILVCCGHGGLNELCRK